MDFDAVTRGPQSAAAAGSLSRGKPGALDVNFNRTFIYNPKAGFLLREKCNALPAARLFGCIQKHMLYQMMICPSPGHSAVF